MNCKPGNVGRRECTTPPSPGSSYGNGGQSDDIPSMQRNQPRGPKTVSASFSVRDGNTNIKRGCGLARENRPSSGSPGRFDIRLSKVLFDAHDHGGHVSMRDANGISALLTYHDWYGRKWAKECAKGQANNVFSTTTNWSWCDGLPGRETHCRPASSMLLTAFLREWSTVGPRLLLSPAGVHRCVIPSGLWGALFSTGSIPATIAR